MSNNGDLHDDEIQPHVLQMDNSGENNLERMTILKPVATQQRDTAATPLIIFLVEAGVDVLIYPAAATAQHFASTQLVAVG